jgi:histidinol dehydrogenase
MLIKPVTTTSPEGKEIIEGLRNRLKRVDRSCHDAVEEILEKVRREGDQALVDYGRKFDSPKISLSTLQVSDDEIKKAYSQVDQGFLTTLNRAIERITSFHQREMEDSWLQTRDDGTIVGRLVRPVDSAGLYVPGGQSGSTPLVSSVLMNGLPAFIAGVERRIMVTPPGENGELSPHLLVAADTIGIEKIYKIGSAWAIAALAYGTQSIEPVDVIVGPGNQFVTEAKRQVSSTVRIDMIAGPSEVLIVADSSADPVTVAADLLAQAEHDRLALPILLTTHPPLAEQVEQELRNQLVKLSREEIARASITTNGVILIAENLKEAIGIANTIAIEHLELDIDDPWAQLAHIRHAGAIFLGSCTPEAAGDYIAGPNHVLPTMGTARFASALGVETFLKKSSLISYSQDALAADGEHIIKLARLEGLDGHAASVAVRLEKDRS